MEEFKAPYAGYPQSALIAFGRSVAIGIFVIVIYLNKRPWLDESVLTRVDEGGDE
ncbi:hypothetical protein [Petroclostridium xylanilyticum]|jgi:NSS family neurotransmitter:Na+ symporter|uniref:hypothetical protein n=1 Tax=Petroclostridium xylanilyticum TaxID=1792311 RepID=UPI0018E2D8B5|nr:hypothetical protein [Petroclostridium xylanilyticum]